MTQDSSKLLTEKEVAALFDGMAEEYDAITDVWYSWLFCRLHYFLALDVARSGLNPGLNCLDVGCGTGFQSVLLNLFGHTVTGIDLSTVLLEKAQHKKAEMFLSRDLFSAPFRFARKYSERIRNLARGYRGESPLGMSQFRLGTATDVQYPDASFDLINCCGSTLSFVRDYVSALNEMSRVLRPGGLLFLEVENKYNADLLWAFLDAKFLAGRIGYEQELGIARQNLFSPKWENLVVNYPFSGKGGEVDMPMWLFSAPRLLDELKAAGFQVIRVRSVHCVTNILPSVALDCAAPSQMLLNLFRPLASLEKLLSSWPMFRRLGCSMVITAKKVVGLPG